MILAFGYDSVANEYESASGYGDFEMGESNRVGNARMGLLSLPVPTTKQWSGLFYEAVDTETASHSAW